MFTSNAGGRPGNWANAPGDNGFCGNCHTSAGSGAINLSGAPSFYEVGKSYNMTLALNDATAAVGGFQMVATNGVNNTMIGSFSPVAGTTTNDVNRLVQSSPKAFAGGSVSWNVIWNAPAAGAPGNVQFYFAGNAANGNGNNGSGDKGYADFSNPIPLPLNLVSFTVEADPQGIELNWSADQIAQHSHFEIQRSVDGSLFTTIGKVDTQNQSLSQSYQFYDEQPGKELYNYYRIKSVDLDKNYQYTETKNIYFAAENQVAASLFPNPVGKEQILTLNLSAFESIRDVTIKWISAAGAVVQTMIPETDLITMNLDQMTPGIYTVLIFRSGKILDTQRLVVLQ